MLHKDSVLALAFEARSLVVDLNAALTELFRPLGLTCVQAEALLALYDAEPTTLTQLSERLVAESGHPSRLVSRLVDRGLVARTRSTADGRASILQLTDRGRALAKRADAARAPLIDAVIAGGNADVERLTEALRGLRTGLAAAQAPAPADGGP